MRSVYSFGFTIRVDNHAIRKSFFHVTVPKKYLKDANKQEFKGKPRDATQSEWSAPL